MSKHSAPVQDCRNLIAGGQYPMPVAAHVAFSDYQRARVAAGLPVPPVVLLQPSLADAPTIEFPAVRRVATTVMPAVRS